MSFSGTISESTGMTMTRLIERIVHTDTPGELRLHDEASGRRASIAIRRGTVQEVAFGELTGDPALTAISQVMPWTFEFVADEAGALPSHPSMVSRGARTRAVVKAAPRPADPVAAVPEPTHAEPAEEQVYEPVAAILANEPAPDFTPPPEPEQPLPEPLPVPVFALTETHRQWLGDAARAHYSIRFGTAGEEFAGAIQADDYDYFRSDFAFLSATSAAIARSLGWDAPSVFAIAEAERATGYCLIDGGFLGIMAGAGGGVQHVIDFPEAGTP
jgi:hypothetical protein